MIKLSKQTKISIHLVIKTFKRLKAELKVRQKLKIIIFNLKQIKVVSYNYYSNNLSVF